MNITTFRKKTNFGGVIDIFRDSTLFIGGWPGEHIVYVKMTRPALVRQYISNTVFQLQYKLRGSGVKNYTVEVREFGGVVRCGGISIVFVDEGMFDRARAVWGARAALMKERDDVRSGEGLWMLFKDDVSYGIKRLAEIQRSDVELGNVVDVYSFVKGLFGLMLVK